MAKLAWTCFKLTRNHGHHHHHEGEQHLGVDHPCSLYSLEGQWRCGGGRRVIASASTQRKAQNSTPVFAPAATSSHAGGEKGYCTLYKVCGVSRNDSPSAEAAFGRGCKGCVTTQPRPPQAKRREALLGLQAKGDSRKSLVH